MEGGGPDKSSQKATTTWCAHSTVLMNHVCGGKTGQVGKAWLRAPLQRSLNIFSEEEGGIISEFLP